MTNPKIFLVLKPTKDLRINKVLIFENIIIVLMIVKSNISLERPGITFKRSAVV